MQLDSITEKYVKVRDAKKKIQEKHKKELEPINKAMELAEASILQELDKIGAESVNTKFGTVYKKVNTSANIADPQLFFDFIKTGDHWNMLQRRLNNSTVAEFVDTTGNVPPGVDITRRVEINVRRS